MKHTKGFALLDVILAIVIFAVGMLALASLQTNLTRSSVDSNARMVAVNIGEEIIERLRTFQRVSTDPDGTIFAFADIDDDFVESFGGEHGGLNYTVTGTVWGYNYNDVGTNVEAPVAAVAGTVYDFKRVELTIAWDASAEFQVDEDTSVSAGDMNSGEVTIEGLISSIPAFSTAQVAAEQENIGGVPVKYTPGARPDIIPLNLENGKLKESTTPLPEINKSDGSSETWFDVITYNGQVGNLFVRREEFLVVSCECTLKQATGDDEGGFLPTIWNGKEYVTGPVKEADGYVERDVFVNKLYGESTSNTSSVDYCVTCCRDHHDDTENYDSADEVYDPARIENNSPIWTEAATSGATSGDHKHYSRSKKGELVEAKVNDTYVEACRMVRKDGFMRVAQDFRQEGFNAFPEGFLDTADGAEEYASYAITAVDDFHNNSRDTLVGPDGDDGNGPLVWTPIVWPGMAAEPTALPYLGVLSSQQMRSRGIYIDHLGAEAKEVVKCLQDNEGLDNISEICETPGMDNYLQAYPFFEVQTTFLSWWNEDKPGYPVEVTNEAAKTDNAHSRGKAMLLSAGDDKVVVTTDMHRGNIGLSVTDDISPSDSLEAGDTAIARGAYELFVNVNAGGTSADSPSAWVWSGTFESAVNGINAADADVIVTEGYPNTYCSRSGTSLGCLTTQDRSTGSITISGYYKNAGTSLWICAANFPDLVSIDNSQAASATKSAVITWNNVQPLTGVELSIESSACDP